MLDNSDTKTVVSENLETPNGLGVDWIANNIYWTDNDHKVISAKLKISITHRSITMHN